jgi:chorismate mutase
MIYSLVFSLLVIFSLQTRAEVTSAELFSTINERLSYMEDVALFKAQKHLPIENIEREKTVLDKAKMSANIEGLDPDYIEDFFKAQIAVAKAIQFRYRADLLSEPSIEKPRDLQKEVRPALLDLGDRIIKNIVDYVKTHGSIRPTLLSEFNTVISMKYVAASDKKLLFEALQRVKLLPVK